MHQYVLMNNAEVMILLSSERPVVLLILIDLVHIPFLDVIESLDWIL